MGVIQRQGIKDSIVTYVGVGMGAINALFLYPYFLQKEELGLFQFLVSTGMILSLFMAFGANDLATRFFPVFRNEARRHRGFLLLLLLIPLGGLLLVLAALAAFYSPFMGYLENKDPLIRQYWPWVLPLAFFIGLNYILVNYTKNFLRIVVPTVLENLFVKVCTAILAAMLFYSVLSLSGFAGGIALTYGMVTLGLIGYLLFLGQWSLKPDWKFLDPSLMREMAGFAFYGMLGSFSAGFLTWLDRVMIGFLMGKEALESVGLFSIPAYIGMVIAVPGRSLEKIAAPVAADAFQRRDIGQVAVLYRKSSINQFIAGALLFLVVWLNMDDIFALMPNGEAYAEGKDIVLILGVASLVSMVSGISHQILVYSPYYRLNFYLLLVLAGLNVVLNYLLIRTLALGITGAALATLFSMILFHAAKYLLIYRKLGIQPFSRATVGVLMVGAAVFIVFRWAPSLGHPLLTIPFKSALITLLFAWPILHFRLSADLNDLWAGLVQRLGLRR